MTDEITTLAQGFATDEALRAATLRDALDIRAAQWATRGTWTGNLRRYDERAAHDVWLDGNAEVLAHWGQAPRAGLTDDEAVMSAPNPTRAIPA